MDHIDRPEGHADEKLQNEDQCGIHIEVALQERSEEQEDEQGQEDEAIGHKLSQVVAEPLRERPLNEEPEGGQPGDYVHHVDVSRQVLDEEDEHQVAIGTCYPAHDHEGQVPPLMIIMLVGEFDALFGALVIFLVLLNNIQSLL